MPNPFDEYNRILKRARDQDGHPITQIQWDDAEYKYLGCITSLNLHMGCLNRLMLAAKQIMGSLDYGESSDDFVAVPSAAWREFVDAHARILFDLEEG